MANKDELDLINSFLKEGRIQEAANLSARLASEAKAAEDLAAGKVPEPPPPRSPGPIMSDLLHEIVAHLGHTPRMAALIAELDDAEGSLRFASSSV